MVAWGFPPVIAMSLEIKRSPIVPEGGPTVTLENTIQNSKNELDSALKDHAKNIPIHGNHNFKQLRRLHCDEMCNRLHFCRPVTFFYSLFWITMTDIF
jgi:hypothetical protein